MESTQTTLAEIAVRHAAASRVFHRHGLDYCCGGQRPLEEACRERELDPATVLQEIVDESRDRVDDRDWTTLPLVVIVHHIIERYHQPLREELPELIALAEKVELRHKDKTDCPIGLAAHLKNLHQATLLHLEKEEVMLFPMIASGQGNYTQAPVQVMEHEHREHAENLARTRELAHDFDPPEEACSSWRALYLRLAELEADFMEHIHLENNVLFPRAICE